ncbi:hypothetical protein SAVIM40S_07360 [Streptomyces avidinii]
MSWLWAIIVGFVLGLMTKAILPGKQHQPLWLTTLFGIAGAVLGNAVATWIGVGETKGHRLDPAPAAADRRGRHRRTRRDDVRSDQGQAAVT